MPELVLSTLKQFDYLLRLIRERQKKSMVEWIGLVRSALLEVDEAIGKSVVVFEGEETFVFDDFRKNLERVAANLALARLASPLNTGSDQSQNPVAKSPVVPQKHG